MESILVLYVNGKKVIEEKPNPEWTLLYYLRTKLNLCGTKLGCGEGGCGACTVMVSKYDRKNDVIHHLAINACITPVCSMHGLAITTVEGIGSTKTKLHPVQERIAKSHGTQCGFCTPGMVMSMYALLRALPKPSMKELEAALQGNLCRCTGYRPIIEGYKTFTKDFEVVTQNGNGVCQMGKNCCKNLENNDCNDEGELCDVHEFSPYDASQEIIFPPELKLYDTLDQQNLIFTDKNVTWYRPTNLKDLLTLKDKHPNAKIVAGNTEIGIEMQLKHFDYPILIQSTSVPELTDIQILDHGVKIGASASLDFLETTLKKEIKSKPEYKTRTFQAIIDMLELFASKQIRNVATLGGNLITGSPISDLNPIFITTQIELELQSNRNGIKKVKLDETFFSNYRKTNIANHEILVAITIFYTTENQYVYSFKQSKRRDDDIAIVNAAINVSFEGNCIIKDINLAFGGMAPTTVLAPITRQNLIGKEWNSETLEIAYNSLLEDLPLPPNAPGGVTQYRRSLTLSFFFKVYLAVLEKLQRKSPDCKDKSAISPIQSGIPKSSQYFQIFPNRDKTNNVGKPIPHLSAFKHATGEAVYCDDIPRFSNELYMMFVISTKAHANILSIDASEALQMKGVHGFLSESDLSKNKNQIGSTSDELLFYSKKVTAQGQIIGAIIADDQLIAQKAVQKVKIDYQELEPVIISIEDAIKHKSYFKEVPNPMTLEKGDVEKAFKSASHIVEGECRSGNQEHFYLETQSVLAVPKNEDNELEIFCATQYATAVCKMLSNCLDIPQNRINIRVKRIGGGFGGKEHKPALLAIPAALAAIRYGRPVRCSLNRDQDMQIIGGRHAFVMKYKAAFDDDGKILGIDTTYFNNAGYSNDLSQGVMERALLHGENSYNIPNVRVHGYVCKTNLPSNVAFRGFGAPQSMLVGEFIIRKVSEYLNKDPIEVAYLNLYREGNLTPYNQKLEYCTLTRCWEECLASSNMVERRKLVDKYNRENRWKKRGISMVPTKFGLNFPPVELNQAAALIHVYTDGSVLLSHAGVEMGQGLHTKMVQIASTVLEIPPSKIHISETATDKVINTPPTAASMSSDLNGMAVMNTCSIIKERIAPYMLANPKGKWEDFVMAAYMDRVSLTASGFHKTSYAGYDFATHTGTCYLYFTYGVGCSEVEIDCLTGDHQVLRTDIVMDVGESLNPAVDIGQIEGAFTQGYGLYMMEEMMYSPNGTILTQGPGTYKLPGFADIPREFNVSLLKGAPNPRAVYSSKAIGEPPLFLASSVLFATREAIKSARKDADASPDFKLDAPLTPDKIRMACEDHITAKLPKLQMNMTSTWNVTP